MKSTFLTPLFLASGLTLPLVYAGEKMDAKSITSAPPPSSPFDKGRFELQSPSGAYFSLENDSSGKPTMNYSLSSLRLGVMLSEVNGEGCFRGNTELLVEGFVGSVFDGPGDYFGGAMLQLRYNFVQPAMRWVPYMQIGAGGFYSDIDKDLSQNRIGRAFQYTAQVSSGMRYLLNDRWALSLETGYRAVFNSGSTERNDGLHSLGAEIAFIRFF